MLAGSGLRIEELCGLRIGDVDWLRRSVKVERTRARRTTGVDVDTHGLRHFYASEAAG
jgi:integrase